MNTNINNNKAWYKSYPEEVVKYPDFNAIGNLSEYLNEQGKKFGDKIAFEHMGTSLTYSQFNDLSNRFTWYFQNKTNLKKGDVVAIQMPNCLQTPILIHAAIKAGFIIVNTNPLYTSEEMKHQFKTANVKALFILENFAHRYEKIKNEVPLEYVFISGIGDLFSPFKRIAIHFVVKYLKKMIPPYRLEESYKLTEIIKQSPLGAVPEFAKSENNEVLLYQFTGGTTGVPKAAELTHYNIKSNIIQLDAYFGYIIEEGKEVTQTALPMYHIFAFTVNCLYFYIKGMKNVLITNPKEMNKFLKSMAKNPPSIFVGVNTLFNGILNNPLSKTVDWSKLKLTIAGGMALQESVAQKWKDVTGNYLLEGYGLTETSPAACINPNNEKHKIGSIGLPVPGTDIILLKENKEICGINEIGEIAIKGPQVMKGYYNQINETKDVFYNGYLLTGDLGLMDEDGFFKIIDRKKEMINVSGFNVYPNEIENIIAKHEKVLEVGVRGEKHEKSHECVAAYIVKKDDSLNDYEIIDFCKQFLTNYKIPKKIYFRESLPKSNVGKILRRKLS